MLIVSDLFKKHSRGEIRPVSWGAMMAFEKKKNENTAWFVLNSSKLDESDLLGSKNNDVLNAWDLYNYTNYSDRIISQSVSRELLHPSGVMTAIADFEMNNFDGLFTPNNQKSPLLEHNKPKRPVRLFQGFNGENYQQFVGITETIPSVDTTNRTAKFTAQDFLTWVFEQKIEADILHLNKYTGEILTDIFKNLGFTPKQMNFSRGSNRVPFYFFEKEGATVGEIVRPLIEAENGRLWLDESGILRFEGRLENYGESVAKFSDNEIISVSQSESDNIINAITIKAEVRELKEPQVIYSASGGDEIESGKTFIWNMKYDAPSINIERPVFFENTGKSYFLFEDTDGNEVNSGVSMTGVVIKSTYMTIFLRNSSGKTIKISDGQIWGEPAKIRGGEATIYEAENSESVEKYERKTLEIENAYVQTVAQARALAYNILEQYSEWASELQLEVKGTPALQLGDVVEIDNRNFKGKFKIYKIENNLSGSSFSQKITVRSFAEKTLFTLNKSKLNETDQLG